MQLCFSPSGSLPVPSYLSLIPIINRLHVLPFFSHVVLTQDWHPPDHVSFHTSHPPPTPPFSTLNLTYDPTTGHLCSPPYLPYSHPPCPTPPIPPTPSPSLTQTLWPPHCTAHTPDAAFHPSLLTLPSDLRLPKGVHSHVDSYSAFRDVRGEGGTGLAEVLGGVGGGAGVAGGGGAGYLREGDGAGWGEGRVGGGGGKGCDGGHRGWGGRGGGDAECGGEVRRQRAGGEVQRQRPAGAAGESRLRVWDQATMLNVRMYLNTTRALYCLALLTSSLLCR